MSIFEQLSDYISRQRDLREIDSLSQRDIADFASNPAALRDAVLSRPKVREQMLAMAERFGLSEEDINEFHWRETEIVHRCQNCKDASACRRFLDGKRTFFLPQDCPNAETYSEIVAEHH